LEFELKVFKDGYLLKYSQEMNAMINDTCISLGKIANSVFASPIQEDVGHIVQKFDNFLSTYVCLLLIVTKIEAYLCYISILGENLGVPKKVVQNRQNI
jgi:hypothetical protein